MKYRIEMEPLAGRYVVALKDPDTGNLLRVHVMNASAAEMLRLHLEGNDIPSIARILSGRYGVDAGRIAADAGALFEKMGILPE